MTQIAVTAGSNASVTITAGQKLLIGGQGTYRIGPLGTSQRPTVDELIDTMSTVGPFSDTCTVQIWATGSGATYEVFATTDAADQTGRPYSVSGEGIAGKARLAPNLLTFGSGDNWESLFGGDTITYGTSNRFRSQQTMSFTAAGSSAGIKRSLSTPVTLVAGAVLQLTLWVPESVADAGTANVTMNLSSNATTGPTTVGTKRLTLPSPAWGPNAIRSGGLQALTVTTGEDGTYNYDGGGWTYTAGEKWGNAFNYIDIRLGNLAGVPVFFDSLSVGVKDKPRVVLTFDNVNGTSLVDIIAPALAAMGWTATLMMDANLIAANAALILTLVNVYGWEVGSMGNLHVDYSVAGAAQLTTDMPIIFAAHAAIGLPRPTSFAYPGNKHTAACDAVLAANGFTWRRSIGTDILPNGGGNSVPQALGGLIRSGFSQLLGTNSAEIINRIMALCQGPGGVLSLFTHMFSSNSADFSLGVDTGHGLAVLDCLRRMKFLVGLECIRANQVPTVYSTVTRYPASLT